MFSSGVDEEVSDTQMVANWRRYRWIVEEALDVERSSKFKA